jgi:hypothetical protein
MLEFRVMAGRKVYSRHHLGPVAAARARKLAREHPRIRFHVEMRTRKGWRRMRATG